MKKIQQKIKIYLKRTNKPTYIQLVHYLLKSSHKTKKAKYIKKKKKT